MNRKTFLTIASVIGLLISLFGMLAPEVFLANVKMAAPNATAIVMGRTACVFLFSISLMAFLVRDHEDSPTLEAFLTANLIMQLGIMPVDPLAYLNGVFSTYWSFVPNTIVHILLAGGFAYYLVKLKKARRTSLQNKSQTVFLETGKSQGI